MPRRWTKVLVNSGGRLVTDGAGLAARLVLVGVLARTDGPGALGLLALILAIASMGQLAGVAGAADWVAVAVARRRPGASVLTGLRVITRTAPATALLFVVCGAIAGGDGVVAGVGGAALVLTTAPSLVLRGGLVGHGQLRYAAIGGGVDAVVAVAAGALMLALGWGVAGAVAALALGELANVVVTARVLRRIGAFGSEAAEPVAWAVALREGIVLSPIKPLTAMYQRLDVAVLSVAAGTAAVGLYSAATSITLSIPILAVALSEAMFADLARAEDPDRARRVFATRVAALAAPCAVIVFFAGPTVVRLVYGAGYGEATDALRILALALPFTFANIALGNAWIAAGRGGLRGAGLAVGLVVDMALVVLCGARFGAVGAAAATAVSETAQLAFYVAAPRIADRLAAASSATNGPWERPASALMVGSNG